jgi:hypothetical protein
MLFDVVVAGQFNKIRFEIFVDDVFVHLVSVTYMDELVTHAMNYENWTIEILHSFDVRELVPW